MTRQRSKRRVVGGGSRRGAIWVEALVLVGVVVLVGGGAVRAFSGSLAQAFECMGDRIRQGAGDRGSQAPACGGEGQRGASASIAAAATSATNMPTYSKGEKGGHEFARAVDPQKRAPKPEWVPPESSAGLDENTSFAAVAGQGSAAKVVRALDPNLVRDVAEYYGIDGRAIAVAVYEEARAYIAGEGDMRFWLDPFYFLAGPLRFSPGHFKKDDHSWGNQLQTYLKRWLRAPGYGTFHEETMQELNRTWKSEQIASAQQYPQYAVPVIAQEMNAKAAIYEHISGISIRDNPALLAWAYNTSMDNVRDSAEAQKEALTSGREPDFDLGQNRQLGSTPENQRARILGRHLPGGSVPPPDGKGMGDSANSNVVKRLFLPYAPDQPVQRSRIPYKVNGIPFVPGSGNQDPLPASPAG